MSNRAKACGDVVIKVLSLQRRVGESDDRRKRRPETVLMSFGVVRHRNHSDAQMPGSTQWAEWPNADRSLCSARLYARQPAMNLNAVTGLTPSKVGWLVRGGPKKVANEEGR